MTAEKLYNKRINELKKLDIDDLCKGDVLMLMESYAEQRVREELINFIKWMN